MMMRIDLMRCRDLLSTRTKLVNVAKMQRKILLFHIAALGGNLFRTRILGNPSDMNNKISLSGHIDESFS